MDTRGRVPKSFSKFEARILYFLELRFYQSTHYTCIYITASSEPQRLRIQRDIENRGNCQENVHYIQFDGRLTRLTVTLVGLTTQLTDQLIIMY